MAMKISAARPDFNILHDQARKGSWRSLAEAVKEARKLSAAYTPEDRIGYATYHILALTKLGSYAAAAEELAALGDLDKLRYEEYPDLYPGVSGSMVPFGLRLLHAVLPHRLGQTSASVQRFYALLLHCEQKEKIFGEAADKAQDAEAHRSRWRRRYHTVLYYLVNLHLFQKDFVSALRLLDRMLAQRPEDPVLWSKFAYIQLQLGDMEGARKTFTRVDELVKGVIEGGDDSSSSISDEEKQQLVSLLGRNKGLQCFVDKQYAAAVKCFNGVLEGDPSDAIAANNKALSLMYSRDLIRATQVLEDVLQAHTVAALGETLVLNLCSMYELTSVNSNESKQALSSWIIQVAPDDFDLTCTRL